MDDGKGHTVGMLILSEQTGKPFKGSGCGWGGGSDVQSVSGTPYAGLWFTRGTPAW